MNSEFCTTIVELNLTACDRIDPIFSVVFGSSWQPGTYIQYQLLIFALGLFYGCYSESGSRTQSLLATAVGILGSVFILGSEPLYFTACWFPFFLSCLRNYLVVTSPVRLLGLVTTGLLLIWNSGALAPFALLVAIIIAARMNLSFTGVARFAVPLLFILAFFQLPESTFPHYPPGARVTPLSPLTTSHPIVLGGPEHNVNPLLFAEYEGAAKSFALSVLAFTILVVLAAGFVHSGLDAIIVCAILLGLLSGEFLYNDAISLSPFQSMRRVVPGLGIVLVPWSLTLPLFTSVLFSLRRSLSLRKWGHFLGVLLVLYCLRLAILPPTRHPTALAFHKPLSRISSREDRIAFSPSHFVAQTMGSWVYQRGVGKVQTEARLLSQPVDFVWAATASANKENILLALDGNDKTRWSTGRPQQKGDQFSVTFDRNVTLLRVELNLRNNPTDFPRGILIEGSADGSSFAPLVSLPDWMGPLRWTEDDFPYFGPPHDVSIPLPEAKSVRALRFTLISGDPVFDWSITDLKLYGPPGITLSAQ